MAVRDVPRAVPDAKPRWRHALLQSIPTSSGLSDENWRARHRAIGSVAWLHVVGVPLFAMWRGRTIQQALIESSPILVFTLIGTLGLNRRVRAVSITLALLLSSAVLVHLSDGLVEMHFHVFVMIPIIALYQDWLPFGVAVSFVLLHRGVVGTLYPQLVFDHVDAQTTPWRWGLIHAFFVAALSAVCIAGWRINQIVLDRQRRAESDLLDEKRVVETLHTIGTGIVSELDIGRVCQLVTDAAVQATQAEFGAFFYNVQENEGESYMLYTLSGVDRSAFAGFPMPRNTRVFGPTFSGAAVVRSDDITKDERYGHNAPYHGMPPGHLPVRSYLAVPVRSRGSSEVLGGLFFGHSAPGRFDERDERIVAGIATQAAIAFDNARLYSAEREAYEAAEKARARVTMLADIGRILVSSLDAEEMVTNLTRISVPTFADVCVVDMVRADGTLERVDVVGAPGLETYASNLRRWPPDVSNTEHPVVKVLRGSGPILTTKVTPEPIERNTLNDEHAEVISRMDGTSSIVVPLVGRGEALGVVSFLTLAASERMFTEEDVPLAEVLGRRAGMAVENAHLYQAEHDARAEATRATTALSLLAEAGRLSSEPLNQDVRVQQLANLTVPTLADGCLVDILEEDGTISRVAAAAPAFERFATVASGFPPDPGDEQHPVVRVMNGAPSVFVDPIDEAFLDLVTRSGEHRTAAEVALIGSTIIVPLTARGGTYGSLTLINFAGSGKRFRNDDLELAEEVGRRAGIAIENARLYAQQRSVAESLQRALLPKELPSIAGFEVTARYKPGGMNERVGGDWYDLFEVPGGALAIVMGDVVGHGIPAASLMAQLRNALRANAWNGLGPADVLSRLNQFLYGLEREGMATVSLGLLDPVGNTMRVANAGHPPFLRLPQGGEPAFVGEGLGPPLGAVPFATYKEEIVALGDRDTLVFYTDGLVEDRAASIDTGLEKMRIAAGRAGQHIDELCDSILQACIGGRTVEDDVAILVLRALRMGKRLAMRLPAEPRVLSSLRQTLRRWLREHDVLEPDVSDVLVATGEACNNAIEHGGAAIGGWFEIEAQIDGDLDVVVRSTGGWRAPRDDGGGRGLPVMEALMDRVDIDLSDTGIEVRMHRKLNGVRAAT